MPLEVKFAKAEVESSKIQVFSRVQKLGRSSQTLRPRMRNWGRDWAGSFFWILPMSSATRAARSLSVLFGFRCHAFTASPCLPSTLQPKTPDLPARPCLSGGSWQTGTSRLRQKPAAPGCGTACRRLPSGTPRKPSWPSSRPFRRLACLATFRTSKAFRNPLPPSDEKASQQLGTPVFASCILVLLQPQYDMWVRLKRSRTTKVATICV